LHSPASAGLLMFWRVREPRQGGGAQLSAAA